MSMVGSLGVLQGDPAVVSTEVVEDVDGGALGGYCWWVQQWSPLLSQGVDGGTL
jgi:hypothetical protein